VLSIDDLASDWLSPRDEELFSLPACANVHGMVQASWDIAAIQNWIFAPCGMNTPTGLLFVRQAGRMRRFPREAIDFRWKVYEIERRGHGLQTAVRLSNSPNGVIVRMHFSQDAHIALAFPGLPRVWSFADYWNLPPEDVPQMNVQAESNGFLVGDCKTFAQARIIVPGRRAVYSDVHAWLDGDPPVTRGRVGIAELDVRAGDEVIWHGAIGCEESLATLQADQVESAWHAAASHWHDTWQAVFTPNNAHFSGHLPTYAQAVASLGHDAPPLDRLYYMAILTLLMTRRFIPPPTPRSLIATGGQCIWTPPESHAPSSVASASAPDRLDRAYVWGGPEGAPTTSFLWELEFQAPLLARLDPLVLRNQLEAMMRVNLREHWGIETITGGGAGMAYGVNPGAFLSCVRDYVRVTGDRAWALRHLAFLKSCLRPDLTDYGDCQNILECVSSYEHTVASFNALAVQGLRFMADLTGEPAYAQQADDLACRLLTLYADGPWACVQPDGTRRVARTILDFVYVGRCLAAALPSSTKRGMTAFFERELQTRDWLRALAPTDPEALTDKLPAFQSRRADHQATGSYDGWPARAASVLLRFGQRNKAIEWLLRIQELTREGPFGQAHFIHDDGRARKASFFNGNCYFESAGCGFATTILEDL
jgi:hypothetical protein